MAGKLSTHVLDTVRGCPSRNMRLELWKLIDDPDQGEQKQLLKTTHTNQDGRTDQPLLSGAEVQVGIYEIWFYVSDYFASLENISDTVPEAPVPPFLSKVPIRFGISDVDANYHVPLLVSPWAYSTYRGS